MESSSLLPHISQQRPGYQSPNPAWRKLRSALPYLSKHPNNNHQQLLDRTTHC